MIRAAVAASCLLWLQATPAADGDRPPRKLSGTPAEFPAPFSIIRSVLGLPDGRLVVSDPEENRLVLLDFAKGTSVTLGRTGQGPREYRKVGGLYRARGGGVLVYDQSLRRLLPVSATGEVTDVVALPVPGSSSGSTNRGPDPYMSDSLGDAAGGSLFVIGEAKTIPLLRYRPGRVVDTVAHLLRAPHKIVEQTAHSVRTQEVLFAPQDSWVLAPDGRIAVVHASPYQVEWIPLTGPVLRGPVIGYKPVSVTQADKDAMASGSAELPGRQNTGLHIGPGGSPPPPAGAGDPRAKNELLFAEVKSPIRSGFGHWPLLDEGGRLWVERSLPAAVKTSMFDIFDRGGNLVERIEIPAGVHLIGVDARWIYTVRVDADDFEHLQRYPSPR